MAKFFISDLHLEEKRPDITDIFLRFLQKEAKNAEALFILGDFFEVWVGDDDLNNFTLSIFQALKQATAAGLPIYLMHGNRDFLLGKKFFRATGCIPLPDEYVINIAGSPTLLMHGDTLCTEDKSYLKFRKKARNIFFQKLFLWKSLAKRKAIAAEYREKSKNYTSTAPDHIMDVTQSEVEKKMRTHGVQQLIHGHTHRKAMHHFMLENKPATRIVLGPWHTQGNALICEANGKCELIDFN